MKFSDYIHRILKPAEHLATLYAYIEYLEDKLEITHEPRQVYFDEIIGGGILVLGDDTYISNCELIGTEIVVHPEAKRTQLHNNIVVPKDPSLGNLNKPMIKKRKG